MKKALSNVLKVNEVLDDVKINQGLILSALHEGRHFTNIRDFEFKVFSQWGEDGIIQGLINSLEIKNKTFIEFGVEDFFESNCRFLMMKDNWRGFVIDGSAKNIQTLRSSYFFWKHDLQTLTAFVTRENINELLAKSGFDEDVGILSIDLDGNDYHVFHAIKDFRPRILICEFNAVFGPVRKISIPYSPDFARRRAHHSYLYYGASLSAITKLANEKGYSLVGTNSASCNAFFVRDDLLNEKIPVLEVQAAFSVSNTRESRNDQDELSYLSGEDRLVAIQGLPVLNIESGLVEPI
jgi:hypothetical protein